VALIWLTVGLALLALWSGALWWQTRGRRENAESSAAGNGGVSSSDTDQSPHYDGGYGNGSVTQAAAVVGMEAEVETVAASGSSLTSACSLHVPERWARSDAAEARSFTPSAEGSLDGSG
jgi:hypothetical protein